MKLSAVLIRAGAIYAPEDLGPGEVLMLHDRVAAIGPKLTLPEWVTPTIIDAPEGMLIPGFVDMHVHMAGGGGEGGPLFRTPEIRLSQLIRAGVTSVVGVLGTDGTTRSVSGLLAKARALGDQGLSTWIYTGAYEIPTRTITGSARDDIILIDRVIGIGEIAINDHRGSHPSDQELLHLASEARVGGLLAGKPGILHLHVGEGKSGLRSLFRVVEIGDLPISTFVPTHLNRHPRILADAVTWGNQGGYCDLTTGIVPTASEPEGLSAADSAVILQQQGVPWEHISFSSDAQGSIPVFDEQGHLIRMDIGSAHTLFDEVVKLQKKTGWSWERCIRPITSTPARILGQNDIGQLKVGSIAHAVLIKDTQIDTVIAKGHIMMNQGRIMHWDTFEQGDSHGY
ncbi:beta-aspartyl-dipeptidase (metallo-type) [Sulfobacillus thermosulfidooxidans DSM 9293]|uniref:Isoaspartyl dipeptidase n=1 Tax=Sulfobacillus thermosulfidooxidans (strain DSM 9293 / VKM B-1269 / AT-1) TaxID=929705 RepID=A0A1W1WMI9_SULTA|nr:beta-aspartyl-peptidase [Sulfobacillus thermosulfidooxidans]SMC07412.1 beta-aspartyl-dipeptidase (metallo-type) [Sulfobacillus thermosulfidooxidans DSM 9293]